MNNRRRVEREWDQLAGGLRRTRARLDGLLAEAAQRLATAPDLPFSAKTVENMVATARERTLQQGMGRSRVGLGVFAFLSGAPYPAQDKPVDELVCQFCGVLPPGGPVMPHDLMTDICSNTVDARNLMPNCPPGEVLVGSVPNGLEGDLWAMVWPVWNGYEESGLQPPSAQDENVLGTIGFDVGAERAGIAAVTRDLMLGEAEHGKARGIAELAGAFAWRDDAIPWDVWSSGGGEDWLADAVVQTTSFDMAGYDCAGNRVADDREARTDEHGGECSVGAPRYRGR